MKKNPKKKSDTKIIRKTKGICKMFVIFSCGGLKFVSFFLRKTKGNKENRWCYHFIFCLKQLKNDGLCRRLMVSRQRRFAPFCALLCVCMWLAATEAFATKKNIGILRENMKKKNKKKIMLRMKARAREREREEWTQPAKLMI